MVNFINIYDNSIKDVVSYADYPFSFDIETTSMYVADKKVAFMYHWQFAENDDVTFGRTWQELKEMLTELVKYYELSISKRIIVYVHNLGFEFQFMRKYFDWVSVFATDDRKPIKAVTTQGIEFRDSYILSGYSLAKVADNLVSHDIRKLQGDLDYSLIRHYETELTEKEVEYCRNDVLILTAYITEQIEQYGNITKIPLTNTGRVRQYMQKQCLPKKSAKGKKYFDLMQECSLDLDCYRHLKQAFMGGFVHASLLHSGDIMRNVASIDFNSSYPYAMLSEKYPMSRPYKLTDFSMLEKETREYCYLIHIRLYEVQSKLTYETYLAQHKCKSTNAIINNGKIYSADVIETCITDIDWQIINKVYNYTYVEFISGYYFYKSYLPKSFIEGILKLYSDKNKLKGIKGKEVEYLNSKGMLNSCYGMCVTDIIRDEKIYFDDEWITEKPTRDIMETIIDRHNKSRKRFLYYPWGVWVTAYARKNLWQGILRVGDDYIYSDTDSIKLTNYPNYKHWIDDYNKVCEIKLKKMCEMRDIDFDKCCPNGRLLGAFDYEGTSDYFKTLGAKRYLTYDKDNGFKLTVAGLSKKNGVEYMIEQSRGDVMQVFNMFSDGLSIPKDRTGKQTHTYVDTPIECMVTDYKGQTVKVNTLSGVHLENASYDMGLSNQYIEFLSAFKQGYLMKRGR